MLRKIYIFTAAVIFTAVVYIMAKGLGLSSSLDFGAGAYYYADIPGFEQWFNANHYTSQVPASLIFVLFFVWGAVVYRLWLLLDKRSGK